EAEEQSTTGTVAVDRLNFRDAPGTEGEKLSKPLSRGTKVKIVGKEDDWFRVKVEQEGWVMGRYIDKNLK
ncbi:MAG TPA: SH3 domain-containing protein, partial [Bacteroidales bacterium]|nr:SH3 domain-containing protein [Bacteroidales bacterium]